MPSACFLQNSDLAVSNGDGLPFETPPLSIFRITSGNAGGKFQVATIPYDGGSTGLVYVTKMLDRENDDKYTLTVTASNRYNPIIQR